MTDELSDLRRRLAQAEALALTLQQQRDQVEEDAAVLRNALLMLIRFGAGNVLPPDDFDRVQSAMSVGAGADLLAVAEAARAYVLANPEFENLADLLVAIRDAVRRWDR